MCRAAVDGCDAAETCDGTQSSCPANGFASLQPKRGAANGARGTATLQLNAASGQAMVSITVTSLSGSAMA